MNFKTQLQSKLSNDWVSKFCSLKSDASKLQFLSLVMDMANDLSKS